MKTRLRAAAVVAGILVLGTSAQAQKPGLAEILTRVADYYAAYASRVSGAALDEHYSLTQLIAGRMQTPIRFASDLVLLNVNGRVLSLRDPYTVDNVRLREHTPRIIDLLVAPTLDSWKRAQAHAAEQEFRFLFDLILALNDPLRGLHFVSKEMQPKSTFTVEKFETMDGVAVARVGFKETGSRETKFALGTRDNAAASGRLWIDVATGAVHKTELWANSPNEAVVVNVTYVKEPGLDLWLPKKMTETYQWKELDDVLSNRNVGAYGERLFFQTTATYSKARHTPIDLSKTRR